ncbi:MAG: DegT/DnrJ/EryC1/StrS family aminotransferase [Phycisphaerae bacterium]|nr:DegT/DnrJ/EryC1/StrS family aminotransferase [Phycisphaerae bacterium]
MHIRVNIPQWGMAEYLNGIKAVFSTDSGYFIKELLSEVRSFCGLENVYLVSSARYGLMLAIKHLELVGKHIAVPGYVCPDILLAIECAGAKPVAIDVSPGSICFSINHLTMALERNEIDGILAPNSYGLSQDIESLSQLGIPVIEDAAYQAGISSGPPNQPYVLRTEAKVWSFNFKALTSAGGGVLFTSGELACPFLYDMRRANFNELKLFINRAIRSIFKCHIPKFLPGATIPQLDQKNEMREDAQRIEEKSISNLQAAVALAQWKNRDRIYDCQRRNVAHLKQVISHCKAVDILPAKYDELTPHVLPLLLRVSGDEARAAQYRFRQILYSHSVQTKPIYPVVLGTPDKLPNACELADRLLLIPCNESLSASQITLVGQAIQNASEIIMEEFGEAVN